MRFVSLHVPFGADIIPMIKYGKAISLECKSVVPAALLSLTCGLGRWVASQRNKFPSASSPSWCALPRLPCPPGLVLRERVCARAFCQGLLDSIAGIMQSLAVNFLENGSLIILLMQSAIPVSPAESRSPFACFALANVARPMRSAQRSPLFALRRFPW